MTTQHTVWSIGQRIVERTSVSPASPALTVDGETWSYGELVTAALQLGSSWPVAEPDGPAPVTAVLAHRHASSYIGILAALLRGHTYVPVNVEHPDTRNLSVLRKSGAQRIVYGPSSAAVMERLQLHAGGIEAVHCADSKAGHAAAGLSGAIPPAHVPAAWLAYILFTSGSTGEPKGVPISHGNLTAYLDAASQSVQIGPADRCSQTFELTFDLSVHDLLLSWIHGAHLIVPTAGELARPADYIRERLLTHWFSVPSLAYQIRLQGALRPGALPSLRSSLFCGEALPATLAGEWAAATPNGDVENWYGPTEATIACSRHVLPRSSATASAVELVPLGEPLPGMRLTVHAEDGSLVPDGTPGELYVAGPQVTSGYLHDAERNARQFVRLPGEEHVCYRTGDRVVRDPGGPVRFLDRLDNQVKVRGFRIELGEIEAVLRAAAGGVNVVALSWPPHEPSGRFVVAVLEAAEANTAAVLEVAGTLLPDYMVPARLVCLPAFPKNASGKVDRKGIARRVETLLQDAAEGPQPVLTDAAQRLMDAVRAVAPTLSPQRVVDAPTLMSAGMDSLSFISLTAEIERQYGRELGQDEVIEFSLLSFHDLVTRLEQTRRPARAAASRIVKLLRPLQRLLQLASRRPGAADGLNHRTNRSLQFIRRFPDVLASARQPLVVFIGSSGTFRGVCPETFETAARSAGHAVVCLNVGLPGISNLGLQRLAAYVHDCCERAGVRLHAAVYELDPTRMSVLPVNREIDLPDSFFDGTLVPFADGELDAEFEWSPAARGTWLYNAATTQGKRRPNWEKQRDYDVARTFAGKVKFVPAEMQLWYDAVATLSTIADRTLCFVHPANRTMLAELPPDSCGELFDDLLRQVAAMPRLELIPWRDFELTDGDYLDINHLNPISGRPVLTAQLAHWMYPAVPASGQRAASLESADA